MSKLVLPARSGTRPATTKRTPHSQLDQNSGPEIFARLTDWMFAQADIREEASGISVPGARAMILEDHIESNPDGFMVGREFAHVHPEPLPGSLHVKLDGEDVGEVIDKGWGENHFLVDAGVIPVGSIMIYAPRHDEDLEAVKIIIRRSLEFATKRPAR